MNYLQRIEPITTQTDKYDTQYVVLFVRQFDCMIGDKRRVVMDDVSALTLDAALNEAYSLRNEDLLGLLEINLFSGKTKQLYDSCALDTYVKNRWQREEVRAVDQASLDRRWFRAGEIV